MLEITNELTSKATADWQKTLLYGIAQSWPVTHAVELHLELEIGRDYNERKKLSMKVVEIEEEKEAGNDA